MLRLVFGLTFTFLSLIALHWFPYYKRLHPIGNYTIGVSAILVGAMIGGIDWQVWLFAIVGGAAVLIGYLIDWVQNRHVKAAVYESDRVSKTQRN